jgi:hypothetical protein
MTAYDAAVLFKKQIERNTLLKTVLMPTPLKESGPVVKVAVRKLIVRKRDYGSRVAPIREVRLSVMVEATVEGQRALELAMDACEIVGEFMRSTTRLQDKTGSDIPGSRIESFFDEEDSVLDDPDTGKVSWITDEYRVTITLVE